MKTITFDATGGPLIAEVTSGHAQPGSYTLLLWEAAAVSVVCRVRGNFIKDDDDAHELPGPLEANDGRLLECLVTIVVTPPLDRYRVVLAVMQDGHELGRDEREESGVAFGPITVDLFVRLEQRRDSPVAEAGSEPPFMPGGGGTS